MINDLVPSPNAVTDTNESHKIERELLGKFAQHYLENGYNIINETNIYYLISCLIDSQGIEYSLGYINRLTGQQFREMVGSFNKSKNLQKELTLTDFFNYMRNRNVWDYVQPFWQINSKGKFEYEPSDFLIWLNERGFYSSLRNGEQFYLKIEQDKIIREYKTDEIRVHVNTALKEYDPNILKLFHNHKGDPYKDTNLKNLEYKKITALKDDKTTCRFFFKNGFITVSNDGYSEAPQDYSELKGLIWDSQIRPRKILSRPPDDEIEQFPFNQFIIKAMDNDPDRISAARSAFCYLIHQHKSESKAKAILATDKAIADFGNESSGRTGKGLFFSRAIRELVQTVVMNQPKKNDSFPFERVNEDTRVIVYDELSEHFPVRDFFTPLTTDLIINKKNKAEIAIRYEDSPKVIFCSNFPVKGDTDSTFDRLFTVEFGNYFSKEHKPSDEFGHEFFVSWDEYQWNCFYWLIIGWMQDYLNTGLVEHRTENDPLKRLIAQTSHDFAHWITNLAKDPTPIIDFDHNPRTPEIREAFQAHIIQDHPEPIDSDVFRKWMDHYASIYKIIEFSRSGRHWRRTQNVKKSYYSKD